MSIVQNLKMIRAKYRYSQERFADLMNVSRGMINSYENARAEPSTDFLMKLATLIGISVDQLTYGDIHMENLPEILGMNGVKEPEEEYRQHSNLYDIRNLVEEVKYLREEVSKLKVQKG